MLGVFRWAWLRVKARPLAVAVALLCVSPVVAGHFLRESALAYSSQVRHIDGGNMRSSGCEDLSSSSCTSAVDVISSTSAGEAEGEEESECALAVCAPTVYKTSDASCERENNGPTNRCTWRWYYGTLESCEVHDGNNWCFYKGTRGRGMCITQYPLNCAPSGSGSMPAPEDLLGEAVVPDGATARATAMALSGASGGGQTRAVSVESTSQTQLQEQRRWSPHGVRPESTL